MDLFYEGCTMAGIRFTPGYTFSFSDTYNHYVRIVFADVYTLQREEAFKKIGDISRMLNR
jgi:DNA-binding transcriptional MocR family regulator